MKVEGALGSMASVYKFFPSRFRTQRVVSVSSESSQVPMRSLRRPKKIKARAGEFSGISDERQMLFSSPLTPAFMRAAKSGTGEGSVAEEVEDACRSFENYLVEMIVEEGQASDMMDVEELLHCWKNLHSPVLVCTFYGELCNDLFSSQNEDDRP